MHLINATDHPVTVGTITGEPLFTLEPSELLLRLPETPGPVTPTGMSVARFGPVTAVRGTLPPEQPGVLYLVSTMVLMATHDRQDFVAPGPVVRDRYGMKLCCRGLRGRSGAA
ncbi:hypothetical protein [Deinococcus sonorensis]|uniref:Uncharacterized protein n=1 Tax=Deinococcus sonorensis TaxID=309891 RepID=A0ABV8YB92_9DEIO